METPFIFGRIANEKNFTNRKDEVEKLKQNLQGLINTTVISPRRWGKTSLVNKVANEISKKKNQYIVCQIDVFNCRTEEQFYTAYANAILKSSTSAWEDFVRGVKKYLGAFSPKISISDSSQLYEVSLGIDFQDKKLSFDEILNLPQTIAQDTGKKVIMCIDEFQNIGEYHDSLAFQRKLRSHWQLHKDVCYCMYGSKKHFLLDIFGNVNMPFYRFGEIMYINKIKREDWISFIHKRFSDTGKKISKELAGIIADKMKNHPYYTQQLSQQAWFRTNDICTESTIEEAHQSLVGQLSLLFTNIIDTLKPKQINFLIAVAEGESNFSSKKVLDKYDLGTSANIKNLRNSTREKDLIEVTDEGRIELQDPVFEYWLLNYYK